MTTKLSTLFLTIILASLSGGCGEQAGGPVGSSGTTGPGGAAPASRPARRPASPQAAPQGAAKVLETMNAASYTYVKVAMGGAPTWFAAPAFKVAVGDAVLIPAGAAPMRDFESKSLDRTFELVYFASAIKRVGEGEVEAAVRDAHGAARAMGGEPQVDVSGVAKPEGGLTVAEIHKRSAELSGKPVTLRGKVVKFNGGIMSRNWIHVRDGTGATGTNDLTVTTQDTAKVGDTVLVKGKLATGRDFGFGYQFAVIVEEASVKVEQASR